MNNTRAKIIEQEAFICRWNAKADAYAVSTDPLVATFDEFVTRFIVYNVLYRLCAEKLSYSPKTWEATKAVDAVYRILETKSVNLLLGLSSYIETMYCIINENHFVIDTPAKDVKILKGMSSSNTEAKLKSTLTCLYKLRCNLVHGDKEYAENQRPLLEAANHCLKILNDELYLTLKE